MGPASDSCEVERVRARHRGAVDVNEVLLLGVELRYEFTNADGVHLGVAARRTGDFELVTYSKDDSDQGRPLFRLTRQEADTVAEILGAPRIAERFADLILLAPSALGPFA